MYGMGFRRGFGVLWLAALIGMPAGAAARDTVTWAVLHFPPFQNIEGPHQGSGSFDGELQTLIARMPQFEHKIVPMSFARRKEEFLAGSNICTPGIFRAPALALNLALSLPALTHLDNRVVFLKENADLFGGDDPLDLDALFARGDVIGGLVPGRSYAPNIDSTIERFRGSLNLFLRPLQASQLFQMLLNGDIHYLLLFSHEAAFLAQQFGVGERIANRAIAGTPPYIFTHVACSGNAWGRGVIEAVDAILKSERDQPDYRRLSERWYPPEDQARVRGFYPAMLKASP